MGLACAIPHLSWGCNLTLSLKNDVIWILLVMTWTWLHTCAWSLSIITTSQGESDACSVLHALTHSLTHFSAQFQIKLLLWFLKLKTNTQHMILSNCSPPLHLQNLFESKNNMSVWFCICQKDKSLLSCMGV